MMISAALRAPHRPAFTLKRFNALCKLDDITVLHRKVPLSFTFTFGRRRFIVLDSRLRGKDARHDAALMLAASIAALASH